MCSLDRGMQIYTSGSIQRAIEALYGCEVPHSIAGTHLLLGEQRVFFSFRPSGDSNPQPSAQQS